jgi:hypothetical protein
MEWAFEGRWAAPISTFPLLRRHDTVRMRLKCFAGTYSGQCDLINRLVGILVAAIPHVLKCLEKVEISGLDNLENSSHVK